MLERLTINNHIEGNFSFFLVFNGVAQCKFYGGMFSSVKILSSENHKYRILESLEQVDLIFFIAQ